MVSATAQQPQLQMLRVLSINVDKFGWRGMRRERPEYAVFTLVSATVSSADDGDGYHLESFMQIILNELWRICMLRIPTKTDF